MMNKKIMYDVKDQLLDIKLEKNHDEKINKCVILLNYLNETKLQEIKPVIDIFSNGILDDCDDVKTIFDEKKYFNLLFPTVNYEVIPIKKAQKIANEINYKEKLPMNGNVAEVHTVFHPNNNNVAEGITVNLNPLNLENTEFDNIQDEHTILDGQKIRIIDNYYDGIQPNTKHIVEIKDINNQLIFYKEFTTDNNTYTEPTIVFNDFDTKTYTKINFVKSLSNSMLEHASKIHNVDDNTKNKIRQMLNDNWTMEQIKDDDTFNLNPCFVKLNDNSYDIYLKKFSKEVVKGTFWNGSKIEKEMIHIGNYGFLLL